MRMKGRIKGVYHHPDPGWGSGLSGVNIVTEITKDVCAVFVGRKKTTKKMPVNIKERSLFIITVMIKENVNEVLMGCFQ